MLSLAILVFELVLTRIFSVTLYYHLAFFVISVTMLGTGLGAMVVFCRPDKFPPGKENTLLATYALSFGLAAPAAVAVHVLLPLMSGSQFTFALSVLLSIVLVCLAFTFAGIAICLVLTRYPEKTNAIYACDLSGAACGCLVFALTLGPFDGLSEVLVVGVLAFVAAFAFAFSRKKLMMASATLALVLMGLSAFNSYLVNQKHEGFRIAWARGMYTGNAIYEKWSPLARITVKSNPGQSVYDSMGYSPCGPKVPVKGLDIDIDGSARTSMVGHPQGSPDADFLKYDVAYIGHYLRPSARVLVIGAGGGRDILAALAFKQKYVQGVELNPDIVNILTKRYGDFSGNLAHLPNVSLVNDEARSYITRSPYKYDIIQMSLIDTWAATSSGAYVLSENCLYTTEAWRQFFKHLNPHGIFSVTRWYMGEPPLETMRTLALASQALSEAGVTHPENNIIVITSPRSAKAAGATFLMSPEPFSKADVQNIARLCKDLKFDLLLAPGMSGRSDFQELTRGNLSLWSQSPYNLVAPVDDKPFFFNVIKPERLFDLPKHALDTYAQALLIVFDAVVVAIFGSLLLAWLPLSITKWPLDTGKALAFAGYFFAIGLGFMFVEISQIQRLIVFLGHPVYGITCVMFVLLLAAGMGSMCVQKLPRKSSSSLMLILSIVIATTAAAIFLPAICDQFRDQPTLARLVIASLAIFLPGFSMGFALPLGMFLVKEKAPGLSTWLWGLNCASSVIGSVVALLISLAFGIRLLSFAAAASYALALLCFILVQANKADPASKP